MESGMVSWEMLPRFHFISKKTVAMVFDMPYQTLALNNYYCAVMVDFLIFDFFQKICNILLQKS